MTLSLGCFFFNQFNHCALIALYLNLCGPIKTPSLGGGLYFLIFIYNLIRYTHIDFLKKKLAILSYFNQYKSLVENHKSKTIFILCYNKRQFTSKIFNKICKDSYIQHQLTNPCNPLQNNVSKCKNKILVESARSIIYTTQLPKCIG